MRGTHDRLRRYGSLSAIALGIGALGLAAAPLTAAAAPPPIGPNQVFQGQVNGVTDGAVIKVVCLGPVTSTSTGHPVSGQTVDALYAPGSTSLDGIGYTGSAADHLVVDFGGGPVIGTPVTLSAYDTKVEIPDWLNLPCSGTGKVNFVPAPTSSTARTATVVVTYENIGV